jgi:hypothetical protein
MMPKIICVTPMMTANFILNELSDHVTGMEKRSVTQMSEPSLVYHDRVCKG